MKRGATISTRTSASAKSGGFKIRYSRPIPDSATVKEVSFKKETTGEWFVSFRLETDDADLPEKPDVDSTHPVEGLHTAVDGRNVLLDGQANAGLRPVFAVLVSIVP
jgi:hypothetical protein